MSIESVTPSNYLILCGMLLFMPSIFLHITVFSNKSALHIRGQSIGASASASVLPVNIQDWFPLGLTGLTSLPVKGLSRIFSHTTIWKNQFFGAQSSLWSNSQICTWLTGKAKALTKWTFVGQSQLWPSVGHHWSKWHLCFLVHCLGSL